MAKTTFDSTDALAKKVWDEELYRDVEKELFWKPWMGNNSESIVHVKTNLEKGKGDKITFGICYRLSGTGITGQGVLEGNEEALDTADYSIELEQYRHAVRIREGLDVQRIPWDVADEMKSKLKIWGAEKTDSLIFDAAFGAHNKVFYRTATSGVFASAASWAAGVSAISDYATQKITPAFISQLKTWAKTGGNRSQIPVRPIKEKGDGLYVMLVHDDALYDLKVDSTYAQANREAMERGKSNPLFTGAVGVWDNVIVKAHESVTVGGTSNPYSYGLFMGAQALAFAWGQRPKTVLKTFDYDNETGAAWVSICKAGKPAFDSKNYGSLAFIVGRTNVSGT